ncbi:hypothetical protein ThrDRAFT_02690 [Frankia casuarinae]|uniref:hypothetical protein n=1 Tax=Frankia casuarinae (strain DSM 45818 / CECT 9043 / HFP020203 / CcI3) TaxID=106370 RepID=UPI00045128E5|nr:hypothetical protein [Frankia casuarinae]EYT91685.1 hypothetical protein ThrDRAFT_02690 [Frankia casuarinae]
MTIRIRAVLPLAALERGPDRRAGVLDFDDSAYRAGAYRAGAYRAGAYRAGAYRAGAYRAGRDIERFACPHGVTDPVLASGH